MIRAAAFLALGVAIWAGAYAVPGHTGGWGILRGMMIAVGSLTAGFWTGRAWDEVRDRLSMRLRWWRTRSNGRHGRTYDSDRSKRGTRP